MGYIATIGRWYGVEQHCQAWLRGSGTMLLLLILVALRLGDPLACATHCRIWMLPASFDALIARQHSQHPMVAAGNSRAITTSRLAVLAQPWIPCIDAEQGSPVVPSTPFHEHWALLAIVSALVIVFLIQHAPVSPAHRAPWLALRPPLRPPIRATS